MSKKNVGALKMAEKKMAEKKMREKRRNIVAVNINLGTNTVENKEDLNNKETSKLKTPCVPKGKLKDDPSIINNEMGINLDKMDINSTPTEDKGERKR